MGIKGADLKNESLLQIFTAVYGTLMQGKAANRHVVFRMVREIKMPRDCFSRDQVPTNSVPPSSVYKAYTTHNSSICSAEGLTLETSAFQSLYGGQFTLSTPLINQILVY